MLCGLSVSLESGERQDHHQPLPHCHLLSRAFCDDLVFSWEVLFSNRAQGCYNLNAFLLLL